MSIGMTSFMAGYIAGVKLRQHRVVSGEPPTPTENPYLTFSSPEPFTLAVANARKNWDGILEYSTDTTTWTVWDGTTTLASGSDNKLYLRGSGSTKITGMTSSNYRWVLNGSPISCEGDIRTLLDYADPENAIMASYCYSYMFYDCASLASAPMLPATTLTRSCYRNMFYGCTSLIIAPDLPATVLASNCYTSMFNGCVSLVSAPDLPATSVAESCYYSMFYDCTSLVQPPNLPSTMLAESCYENMFYGCTALVQAPALPATTLAPYCYTYMFYKCMSLKEAPQLPATQTAYSCYDGMFNGCTSLMTIPALQATKLDSNCYYAMFYGCKNIKLSETKASEYQTPYRIPVEGTGTTVSSALQSMFTNTGGTFTGTPTINTTYYTANEVV